MRVLVVGAKDEGERAARTLIQSPFIEHMTIADISMEDAEALVAELQAKSAISLVATKVNTSSREELLRLLAGHDFAAGAIELVASMTTPVSKDTNWGFGWPEGWQGPGWPEGWKGPGWPAGWKGPGFPEGWTGPGWPEGFSAPEWPQPPELPLPNPAMICGKIPVASVPSWLAGCACVDRSPQVQKPTSATLPLPTRPVSDRAWAPDRGPVMPSWDDPKAKEKQAELLRSKSSGGTGAEEWRIFAKSITEPPGDIAKTPYLKQLTRLGIPSCWRGLIWCFFGGVLHRISANKGYYQRLHEEKRRVVLEKALPESVRSKITEESRLKYVPAFCSHERFQGDRGEKRLGRVLTAYMFYTRNSSLDEDIGLIARALLIHMEEERAFWALVILTQEIAPIDYFSDSAARLGADVDAKVVHEFVKRDMADSALAISRLEVDFHAVVFRWLLSLFLRSLQFEAAMRVWDILFYSGPKGQGKVLLEAALAIVFEARATHSLAAATTASNVVSALSKAASSLPPDRLVQLISMQPCALPFRHLEAFRLKFRAGLHPGTLFSVPVPFPGAHICLCPSDKPHVCRPAGPFPPDGIVAQALSNVAANPAKLAKIRAKGRPALTKPGEQCLF